MANVPNARGATNGDNGFSSFQSGTSEFVLFIIWYTRQRFDGVTSAPSEASAVWPSTSVSPPDALSAPPDDSSAPASSWPLPSFPSKFPDPLAPPDPVVPLPAPDFPWPFPPAPSALPPPWPPPEPLSVPVSDFVPYSSPADGAPDSTMVMVLM